jgi:orotate phosphoribosyltransferase
LRRAGSFAAALCDRVSLPLAIVRRGDEPLVCGAAVNGRNVTIVKDMMRTGAAVERAASVVRAAGGVPGQVLCAINWNPELASELDSAGLTLTAAVVGWDLVTYT